MNWEAFVAALLAGFLVYNLYKRVKNSPDAFNKENLMQSTYILGLLALALMGLVAFCVIMLRG